MCAAEQRAGVLPLVQVPGCRRERDQHDLVPGLLARVRVLEREPAEEVDVDAKLSLPRARRLELPVAERVLHGHAAHHAVRLILGIEGGTEPGGPVGRA